MVKWQLETHAKLTTAYKAGSLSTRRSSRHCEVQAGVAIRGRNPFLNLELMNDELKKHCITIMTEQHFDLFDAIQTGSVRRPADQPVPRTRPKVPTCGSSSRRSSGSR